jgi:hypothetical protein
VNHSYEKRLFANRNGMMMNSMLFMFHRFMKMRMDMQTAFVLVGVDMKRGAAENLPENIGAQSNEHYGDGKLHGQGNFGRYLETQGDDQKADGQKRGGMPQSPQRADEGGIPEPLPFGNDGGDGDQMVGIEGVPQPQKESEAEDGDGASVKHSGKDNGLGEDFTSYFLSQTDQSPNF